MCRTKRTTRLSTFVLVLVVVVFILYHRAHHGGHNNRGRSQEPPLSTNQGPPNGELSTRFSKSNSSASSSSGINLLPPLRNSSLSPISSSETSLSPAPIIPTPTSDNNLSPAPSSENTPSPSPHYLIFIVVLSTCTKKGQDNRAAIRDTWAQYGRNKVPPVLVKFSIGTLGLSPSDIAGLAAEDKAHGDLLLLTHLHDSYSNLTRKVLYSFVWAEQNVQFSFLMKTDDDTFVYVDELHKEAYRLHQDGVGRLYWGHFNWQAYPITKPNSKWAEHSWFLCNRYFPYAYGNGYLISSDLIRLIAITSDYLQLYNSEDVSVGVWLAPYKTERKDDDHFYHFGRCKPRSICYVVTIGTAKSMYRLHQSHKH